MHSNGCMSWMDLRKIKDDVWAERSSHYNTRVVEWNLQSLPVHEPCQRCFHSGCCYCFFVKGNMSFDSGALSSWDFFRSRAFSGLFFLIRVMMFDDHGILEPEENHLLQLSSTDVHRAACVLTSFFLKSTISSLVLLMLSYRLFSENLSMWTLTVIL